MRAGGQESDSAAAAAAEYNDRRAFDCRFSNFSDDEFTVKDRRAKRRRRSRRSFFADRNFGGHFKHLEIFGQCRFRFNYQFRCGRKLQFEKLE